MINSIQPEIAKFAKDLNLSIFARYKDYIQTGRPFEENLLELLKEQALEADNNRIKRRIRYAGFPILKNLNAFEVNAERYPNLNMILLQKHKKYI